MEGEAEQTQMLRHFPKVQRAVELLGEQIRRGAQSWGSGGAEAASGLGVSELAIDTSRLCKLAAVAAVSSRSRRESSVAPADAQSDEGRVEAAMKAMQEVGEVLCAQAAIGSSCAAGVTPITGQILLNIVGQARHVAHSAWKDPSGDELSGDEDDREEALGDLDELDAPMQEMNKGGRDDGASSKVSWRKRRDCVGLALDEFIDEVLYARESLLEKSPLVDHLPPGDVLMVLGSVGTGVQDLLTQAVKARPLIVMVTETTTIASEGRQLAQHLCSVPDSLAEVILISHAAAFGLMPRVHKVLIGADVITSDGGAVSHAGAKLVATAAKHYAKPVLVSAELYRLAPDTGREHDDKARVDDNPFIGSILEQRSIGAVLPKEMLSVTMQDGGASDAIENIHVVNVTTDVIPAHLISLFLTEVGAIAPSSMNRISRERYGQS